MPETETTNLGRAITSLGIEDRFLANGELSTFSLQDRARIAQEIIDAKLDSGRWESVIEMMWGGFGKADVLYEGSLDTLRQRILESARQRTLTVNPVTLDTLSERKEYDFILDLATTIPNLNYEAITSIADRTSRAYFEDPNNAQRVREYHRLAAAKALEVGRAVNAHYHFVELKDEDSIDGLFETVLSKAQTEWIMKNPWSVLEQIALSNYDKREERLRRILTSFSAGKLQMDAHHAFKLFEQNRVRLSDEEKADFYEVLAERLHRNNFTLMVGGESGRIRDPELALLWARKKTEQEPVAAYRIFTDQNYEGEELKAAVFGGILKRENGLTLSEVKSEHLRMVYDEMPFDSQVRISRHLEDRKELSRLSHLASEQGDLREAYNLWIQGGNGFEGEFIDYLRSQLIQKEIDKGLIKGHLRPTFYFLDSSDVVGHIQAFDALMRNSEGSQQREFLYAAHELASRHDVGGMLDIVRREIVALDPDIALKYFAGKYSGKDTVGFGYALGVIAKREGVSVEQLRPIAEKYIS